MGSPPVVALPSGLPTHGFCRGYICRTSLFAAHTPPSHSPTLHSDSNRQEKRASIWHMRMLTQKANAKSCVTLHASLPPLFHTFITINTSSRLQLLRKDKRHLASDLGFHGNFPPFCPSKPDKTFREPSDGLFFNAIFEKRRNNNTWTKSCRSSKTKGKRT